jgi:hypothetical protein
MKLYKPIGLFVSVLGGLIEGALFKRPWRAGANESDAPEAKDHERSCREVIAAAAMQGAVFGGVKALIGRAGATGFVRLTGARPVSRKPRNTRITRWPAVSLVSPSKGCAARLVPALVAIALVVTSSGQGARTGGLELRQNGNRIVAAGEVGAGLLGYDVALSADGDTALVGARTTTDWSARPGCSCVPIPPGASSVTS